MAGKSHKPGAASRKYTIHGTSKEKPAVRKSRNDHNVELRTLTCRGCGRKREPRSGPFCPDCSRANTNKD